MKIKTFKFEVSNWSSSCNDTDKNGASYAEYQKRIATPEQIDKTINEFCKGKTIKNINVNNIDINYHNNARGNTIEMMYTIIYEENK